MIFRCREKLFGTLSEFCLSSQFFSEGPSCAKKTHLGKTRVALQVG